MDNISNKNNEKTFNPMLQNDKDEESFYIPSSANVKKFNNTKRTPKTTTPKNNKKTNVDENISTPNKERKNIEEIFEENYEDDDFSLPDLDSYEQPIKEEKEIITLPDAVEYDGNELLDSYEISPKYQEIRKNRKVNIQKKEAQARREQHEKEEKARRDKIAKKQKQTQTAYEKEDEIIFENPLATQKGGVKEFNDTLKSFTFGTEKIPNAFELDETALEETLEEITEDLEESFIDVLNNDSNTEKMLANLENATNLKYNYYKTTNIDESIEIEEEMLENFNIDTALDFAIKAGASDLHIKANDYLALTIRDEIYRIKKFGIIPPKLTPKIMYSIITNVLESEFTDELELDTSYVLRSGESAGRRTRLNIAKDLGNINMTFRIISDSIPTPDDINIPQVMRNWFKLPDGLLLINGPTGTGKALFKEEKVPTTEGFKKVKNIKPGDFLFDEHGKPTKVLSTHFSADKKHYTVIFNNGQKIKTAGNHLWKVEPLNSKQCYKQICKPLLTKNDYNTALKHLETLTQDNAFTEKQITTTKTIIKMFPESSPKEIIKTINRECSAINENNFLTIEILTILINETQIRKERLEKIKNNKTVSFILSTQEILECGILNNKKKSNWAVNYVSQPIHTNKNLCENPYLYGTELLTKIKTQPKKTLKEMKHFYLLPCIQKIDLIKGILKQSNQNINNNKCVIKNNNKKLVKRIFAIIASLGWKATKINKTNINNETIFSFKFYPNKTGNKHIIKQIKPLKAKKEDFICFEVDSENHLYLTSESFIPTHNTTTLASLLNQVNIHERKKIVTVENPVEFVYSNDGKSLVIQREVGLDTRTFQQALDSAMRQKPNIILIGEVRNRTEIDALIRSSESGHLAISTMHTTSAPTTINRMISSYSEGEKERILATLAEVSRGFANQTLIKNLDGTSMIAVREILPITGEIKDLIREGNISGIREYQIDHKITLEHELVREVKKGTIDEEIAKYKSSEPDFFDQLMKTNFI